MKRAIALFSFVFLLAPSFALADDQATATPAPPAAPAAPAAPTRPTQAQRDAMMQAMRQTHEQMKALHDQEHAQILAALTPTQRNMLANTIGYLALSTKPDRKAAAAKLDAALSAGQRQTILKIASDYHAKSKALMEAAHAKMLSNMPPEMRARMDARRAQTGRQGPPGPAGAAQRPARTHTPNAGRLLLAMGSHGMDGMPRMHGMPGMMPGMPGMRMRAPGAMPPPGAPGGRMRAPAPSPTP